MKPVDVIITGLNTILPLMNDEILKVHVHTVDVDRGGREGEGRRGNVGRGGGAQVGGGVSGRSLTIVRGSFRRRSKREGGRGRKE